MTIVEWDRSQAAVVATLLALSAPAEELSADELLATCWEDPRRSVVLGYDDDTGAVAVTVGDGACGAIRLVVVDPAQQRTGRGRALVAAAEDWLRSEGVAEAVAGAGAPFDLWPGVDERDDAALGLFAEAGYDAGDTHVNLRCSTRHRGEPPAGVVVRRAIDDHSVALLAAFVAEAWPAVGVEVQRAVEQGCCHVALAPEGVVGFACHSVNRAGWIGPLGVVDGARRQGIGAALLGQVCRDLMIAEYVEVEVAGATEIDFFTSTAGAVPSRTFRRLVKQLG